MSEASPAPPPAATKKYNRGPKKQTARELLAERARIDEAMAQIEAAKAKARAQRAEYGQYLAWKVKLQRKEREAREAEDIAMRERIEEKLRDVLKEHREQARADRNQWSDFAKNPVPKKKPLRLSNGLAKDAAFVQQQLSERRLHIDKSTQALRDSLPPRSAPARSVHRTPRKPPPSLNPASPRGDQSFTQQQQGEEQAEQAPRTAAQRIMDRSTAEGELDMSSIASMLVLPEVATSTSILPKEDDGKSVSMSPGATKDDVRRRKLLLGTKKHESQVKDMYDKARTRRLYATSRMLADPPADYMLGTDLLRYIPADVLKDDDAPKAVSGPSDTVFMTQDTDLNVPQAKSASMEDPSPRHREGSFIGGESTTSATKGKALKWRKWDPNAWMKLPDPGSITLAEHRQPEEEQATLEWYKNYYEQYTKVKKRTEATRTYTWRRGGKHVLPPVNSIKFDEE